LVRVSQSELVRDHISALIHQKSSTLDLGFYETPEYHDRPHRARTDGAARPLALLENIGDFAPERGDAERDGGGARSVPGLLPFALLISTLPAFYVALHYTMRHHDWLLTAKETAAELHLDRR
jgi:ATP-binding cassette subfamily B protein